MKTITEFINESLNVKVQGCLLDCGPWRDYVNGKLSWDEFIKETISWKKLFLMYPDYALALSKLNPSDQRKVKSTLDNIKKNIVSCGEVWMPGWIDDYDKDSDKAWELFYNESKCDKDNLCLVFFQDHNEDGDGDEWYYVEFKKNVNPNLIKDFKTLFDYGNDDTIFYQK